MQWIITQRNKNSKTLYRNYCLLALFLVVTEEGCCLP